MIILSRKFSILFIAFLALYSKTSVCQLVNLAVQTVNFTQGPDDMGVGMGHASIDGNWLTFMSRLGVNAARLFVTPVTDLRAFIGPANWGKNLDGNDVNNSVAFFASIAQLRSTNGLNVTYQWKNPINWPLLFKFLAGSKTKSLYGSYENIIEKLNSINMNTILLVENIGCTTTGFSFQTMDHTSPAYWTDRWELYKYSYALALWSRQRGIKAIEFYNEPDLDLPICLTASQFVDFYLLRSLSIQNAYGDFNKDLKINVNKTHVDVNVVGSAFAFTMYSNDTSKFLSSVVVKKMKSTFIGSDKVHSNWTNMHSYSYHSYGKTGPRMLAGLLKLNDSIYYDLNETFATINHIPLMITEHNSHTAAEWNTVDSTPDSVFEASRLASQIINLIIGRIKSQYVFKFSVTPNPGHLAFGAKLNGLHWAENILYPFHISDSTLSAEVVRLLSQLKQSQVFSIVTDDLTNNRTYLSSISKDKMYYYLYAVNDNATAVNLSLNLTNWNINPDAKIIVENVGNGYWGEVSNIFTYSSKQSVPLDAFSTIRLTIPSKNISKTQKWSKSKALFSCTARAGNLSNKVECIDSGIYVGTSNTSQHEKTSVAYIKFKNNFVLGNNSKSFLSLSFQQVIGLPIENNMTILVLGLNNNSNNWNQSSVSWNNLLNSTSPNGVLTQLNTSICIDSVSKNFINWQSLSDLSIVGHITITKNSKKNEQKLIDVSDYVNNAINSKQETLSFLFYRPFRHTMFQTQYGSIKADDLSNGSIIKFASVSSDPPQLIQFGRFE